MQPPLSPAELITPIPLTVSFIHILPFSKHLPRKNNIISLNKKLRENRLSLQARVNKLIKADPDKNYKIYFFDQEDKTILKSFLSARSMPLTLVFHAEGIPPLIGLCEQSKYDLYAAPLAESLSSIVPAANIQNLTIDILSCLSAVPGHREYDQQGGDLNFARDLSSCLTILGLGSVFVAGYTGFIVEKKRFDKYSVAAGQERGAAHTTLDNARVVFQNGEPLEFDNPHFKVLVHESPYFEELSRYYEKGANLLQRFKKQHRQGVILSAAAAQQQLETGLESASQLTPERADSNEVVPVSRESRPETEPDSNHQTTVLFKSAKVVPLTHPELK